jgi:hypothetical protein
MTPRRTLALFLAASLSGCLFNFKNPAEELRAGQVGGTVLADVAGGGTPVPQQNVAVSLKGAAFDQASRPNGRFVVLDLPAGRHRLLFRNGTTWALERDVELAYGSDGQPEGIELGDVVLRYSAAVEGTVSLPAGTIASGVAVDESSGLTAPLVVGTATGGNPVPPVSFRFPMLALGTHLIKLSATDSNPTPGNWVGGQVVVDVTLADQGKTISLANVVPHAATALGRLRFRVQAIGLALSPTQVQVLLTPDPGLPPIFPASDGSVDVTVPEGLYAITLVPPVTAPPLARRAPGGPAPLASFGPLAVAAPVPTVAPPQVYGVVLEGKVAEVGSVYVASDSTILAALSACRADADCGGTCSANVCVGRPPVPPPVTAGINFCAGCLYVGRNPQTLAPPTCLAGPGIPGVCLCPAGVDCAAAACAPGATFCPVQPTQSYCEPAACGFACTPDGASLATFIPPPTAPACP